MSKVQFSEAEISMLKMHYLQEYNTTARKLDELNTILKKLGVANNSAELGLALTNTVKVAGKRGRKPKAVSAVASTPTAKTATAVVKTPGKRGRKPGSKAKAKVAPMAKAAPAMKAAPKAKVAKKAVKKTTKPVAKAASKPVAKVAAKKAASAKPAAKTTAKAAAKAPVKAAAKTAVKAKAAKPAVKAAAKPAAKAVAKAEAPAKAKAGKKVSWAKFVNQTLKASNTPMSAPELLEAGKTQFAITNANRVKAMQALQATLFRLSKKSDTLGSEKTKGSYVGYFLKKK